MHVKWTTIFFLFYFLLFSFGLLVYVFFLILFFGCFFSFLVGTLFSTYRYCSFLRLVNTASGKKEIALFCKNL